MPQKLEIVICHVEMYTTLNVNGLMFPKKQVIKLLEQPDVFNDRSTKLFKQADVSSKRVTKQF